MTWPDSYSPSTLFAAGSATEALGAQHVSTHEQIPLWIASTEAKLGVYPTADALTLTYYATRNAGRNWVDNGGFEVSQSGNGAFTTSDVVGIDRHPDIAVGSTFSTTRVALAAGSLLEGSYEHPARYYKQVVVTSVAGAGNKCSSLHRIDGVGSLAGQNVTFSVWVKANATKSVAFSATQYFGTGGSPSASVTGIGASKAVIGTAWQRLTFFVQVPSIAGKTIGTNNDDCLHLNLWYDAGANFNAETNSLGQQSGTFSSTFWQIRKGWLVADYEELPYAEQLRRCQRWRWVSPAGYGPWGVANTTDVVYINLDFQTQMKKAPTLVAPTASFTAALTQVGVSNVTPTAMTQAAGTSDQRMLVNCAAVGLLTVGRTYHLLDYPLTVACE